MEITVINIPHKDENEKNDIIKNQIDTIEEILKKYRKKTNSTKSEAQKK